MGKLGRPFEKGDSRINRRGRPRKGMALSDILAMRLDLKEGGILLRQTIVDKLIQAAAGGDLSAIKLIFDRLDGKPRETVSFESKAIETTLLEVLKND